MFMKKIVRKILIILITFFIVLSIHSISKAENTSEVEEIETMEESEEESSSGETVQPEKNFVSLSSTDVTVTNDVRGDVFICSAGTVTIDSVTIFGNVFICAKDVKISEYAEIYSSLFIISDTVNMAGSVNGNLYAMAYEFTLENTAYIDLDLFLNAEKITFEGNVYRDVNLWSEEFSLSENAFIDGNLNYSCQEEITIPDEVVSGSVNYTRSNTNQKASLTDTTFDWIYSTLAYIVFVLVIYVISKTIHCKFMKSYSNFVSLLPKYLLYGILGFMATPFVCIILFILGITAPLALILLAIYFTFMLIASASIIITLSMLLADKLKEKITINDTARTILCILAFCIIYKLLRLIPIIGFIVSLVVGLLGFGLLVRSTWQKNEPIS